MTCYDEKSLPQPILDNDNVLLFLKKKIDAKLEEFKQRLSGKAAGKPSNHVHFTPAPQVKQVSLLQHRKILHSCLLIIKSSLLFKTALFLYQP